LLVESGYGQADICLSSLSLKKRTQNQGQNTIKCMNPEFLISPVKSWRETDPVRIFHLFEGVFNMGLSAAGENNLLRAPVVIIGTQDALAEACAFKFFEGVKIG
jgi:hypothetical protein